MGGGTPRVPPPIPSPFTWGATHAVPRLSTWEGAPRRCPLPYPPLSRGARRTPCPAFQHGRGHLRGAPSHTLPFHAGRDVPRSRQSLVSGCGSSLGPFVLGSIRCRPGRGRRRRPPS